MDVDALNTRLDERLDDPSRIQYVASERLNALNKAQRLFTLLTLAIERTASFALTANTTFYTITDDSDFSSFLLPLRVSLSTGPRLQPKAISQLDAKVTLWRAKNGTPINYGMTGLYNLFVYPQPSASGTSLSITFAGEPAALTTGADVPEITEEFHPSLLKFAEYWLLQKNGGIEARNALPLLNAFLDDSAKHSDYTRSRAKAQQYDAQPFDIRSMDRRALMKMVLKSDSTNTIRRDGNG